MAGAAMSIRFSGKFHMALESHYYFKFVQQVKLKVLAERTR